MKGRKVAMRAASSNRWASLAVIAAIAMLISLMAGGGTAHAQAKLLETIAVPSNGSSVLSSTSLAGGTTYRIRASGTIFIGTICSPQPDADAEYFCFDENPPTDVGGCSPGGPIVDHGIGLNDKTNDSDKFPHWGSYNSAHVYTTWFVGQGAPISLNYHDCLYSDNSGSLTVEIWSTPPPGVGGIAELPDVNAAPLEAHDSSAPSAALLAGVILGAVVAGTLVLASATWYARRRLLR